MNIIKAILGAQALYSDGAALGATVKAELSDPAVKAEIAANPVAKPIIDRVSAEWRAVETEEMGIHKANFLTFFKHVSGLLTAAGKLEKDVNAETHDPALTAALASMPLTSAALEKISAEWKALESDLAGIR